MRARSSSSAIPSERVEPRRRFPDFIIAGAMKSGTTSLHRILASDSRIFIPIPEIFFFDLDDIFQHPEFAFREKDRWWIQKYSPADPQMLAWYAEFFAGAEDGQWVGEDSTTYLASSRAAERIAEFLPRAKIILLLRDPAARTYSHYWHLVRSGRATLGFEDALCFAPGTLLQRSLYKPQVERFRKAVGRERLLVLSFEEFVADVDGQVKLVYRFLGIPEPRGLASFKTHYNPALVPRWPRAQLWWNALHRRSRRSDRYRTHLLNVPADGRKHRLSRIAEPLYRTLNPLLPRRPPPMRPATLRMLNEFFAAQNEGLDELAGKDVARLWYRE